MNIWLTGCTVGIGRSMVDEFTHLGFTIAGCGRNQAALEELSQAFPTSYFASIDIADDNQAAAFCRNALSNIDPPNLVINNASTINDPAPLWEVSADELDSLMAVNVNFVANVVRHAVPVMIEHKAGTIVNLPSGWGRSTSPDVAPYCASEWAIKGLTQALAQELPSGLAAVAVNPGLTNTDMLQRCLGPGADAYQSPEQWTTRAAPFLANLGVDNNGSSLTVP